MALIVLPGKPTGRHRGAPAEVGGHYASQTCFAGDPALLRAL